MECGNQFHLEVSRPCCFILWPGFLQFSNQFLLFLILPWTVKYKPIFGCSHTGKTRYDSNININGVTINLYWIINIHFKTKPIDIHRCNIIIGQINMPLFKVISSIQERFTFEYVLCRI